MQVSASIALNSIFLHGFQVGRSTIWLPLPSWLMQDIEYQLNYEGGFSVRVWPKRNLEEKKGKVQQVAKIQHMMVTFGHSPSW